MNKAKTKQKEHIEPEISLELATSCNSSKATQHHPTTKHTQHIIEVLKSRLAHNAEIAHNAQTVQLHII